MSDQAIRLYQVDAFTNVRFSGNPAAVCLLPGPLDDVIRQQIAAEMNSSETAFVEPFDGNAVNFEEDTCFKLRWFTPKTEVDLCGHATVAAAAALLYGEGNKAKKLLFNTLHSGQLAVSVTSEGLLELSMGNYAPDTPLTLTDPRLLLEVTSIASGLSAQVAVGGVILMANKSPGLVSLPFGAGRRALLGPGQVRLEAEVLFNSKLAYAMVVLDDPHEVQTLQPDIQRLAQLELKGKLVGVIVTAKADSHSDYDFVSRFFAPWSGIDEDPVTGSAHAILGPYWASCLEKEKLSARQCSPRGGDLTVTVDKGSDRVKVAGQAVLVFKGELLL